MSIDIRKRLLFFPAFLPLLFSGCGKQDLKQLEVRTQVPPVVVENIVQVRTAGAEGKAEVLLVPKSAIMHQGELTGILVVGADDRLTLRWIRTGRLMHGDVVVLGGLDKGEFVVGTYNPALNEGVTVIKSPRVTKEVQKK